MKQTANYWKRSNRHLAAIGTGLIICVLTAVWIRRNVQAAGTPDTGFAAVSGEKGGEDLYGPYEVVPNWPRPLSDLPGHEKWTWGPVMSVFAESPNRIFMTIRDEQSRTRPSTVGAPYFSGESRIEHQILVLDATGKVSEDWSRWNKLLDVVHDLRISPYDPEKNVWVVDDGRHAIFKFSNDGKKLLQTIGTPNEPGTDEKHFNRPQCIAFMPEGTMFVCDGLTNTRVVKLDKNGKYVLSWGRKGNPPDDRPGYFNVVHSIAIDPVTRLLYVNDKDNRRLQVFDENGKFVDQWSYGPLANPGGLFMTADRSLWDTDVETSKILKYDLQGHLLYSWGTIGMGPPGLLWGSHAISVDQEGNLYVVESKNGRIEKFHPRKGANKEFLVGQPVRAAWK